MGRVVMPRVCRAARSRRLERRDTARVSVPAGTVASVTAEEREEQPVRGLVRRPATRQLFDRRLWPVGPDLEPWVDYVWSVEWDLGDAPPRTSSVISFPAVHLTVEWGSDRRRHGYTLPATLVHGVVTE